MLTAWYEILGSAHAARAAECVDALRTVGVDVRPQQPHQAGGPGLVFFHSVTSELRDALRDAAGDGNERVLAIAIDPDVTRGGSPWPLSEFFGKLEDRLVDVNS